MIMFLDAVSHAEANLASSPNFTNSATLRWRELTKPEYATSYTLFYTEGARTWMIYLWWVLTIESFLRRSRRGSSEPEYSFCAFMKGFAYFTGLIKTADNWGIPGCKVNSTHNLVNSSPWLFRSPAIFALSLNSHLSPTLQRKQPQYNSTPSYPPHSHKDTSQPPSHSKTSNRHSPAQYWCTAQHRYTAN